MSFSISRIRELISSVPSAMISSGISSHVSSTGLVSSGAVSIATGSDGSSFCGSDIVLAEEGSSRRENES